MEVTYQNKSYTLGKKERKVGGEAPAVRIKMLNDETKVIGMMAPKTQVMISLLDVEVFSQALLDILGQYAHKIIFYVVTSDMSEKLENVVSTFDLLSENVSNDYKEFASKFGLNMEDKHIANSLFIINKEGEINYIQIPKTIEEALDLEDFKTQLHETVSQKQKGHTHENWMGV
jgi:thiol peroxidase